MRVVILTLVYTKRKEREGGRARSSPSELIPVDSKARLPGPPLANRFQASGVQQPSTREESDVSLPLWQCTPIFEQDVCKGKKGLGRRAGGRMTQSIRRGEALGVLICGCKVWLWWRHHFLAEALHLAPWLCGGCLWQSKQKIAVLLFPALAPTRRESRRALMQENLADRAATSSVVGCGLVLVSFVAPS